MKTLRTLLFASALPLLLSQPALPTLARAEQSSVEEHNSKKLVEAAYAVAYRALKVTEEARNVSDDGSHPNLSKAIRLAQQIRWRALDLAEQLQSSGTGGNVFGRLEEIEGLVYQLDATKRALQSSHRDERDLQKALNDVRRTYFYLKQLLTAKT